MYRLCHIAHKGFDVGHGGGAVLGKELDDGAADDGTIADFNALNRESQWVEEKNLNFSAVLHPGAKTRKQRGRDRLAQGQKCL